jgi:GrxC family glutaredoxin
MTNWSINQSGDSKMPNIEIYTKDYCPYCIRTKTFLDAMQLQYTNYEVTFDPAKEAEMNHRSGGFTVPQIFINNQPIGGSDNLFEMVQSGDFHDLINTPISQQEAQTEDFNHAQ